MDQNNDTFRITLTVLGEKFTLNIHRDEEIFFRNAQKYVTETIETYKKQYSGTKDAGNLKMILSMACISIAYNYEKAMQKNGKSELQFSLEDLSKDIDAFINLNKADKI